MSDLTSRTGDGVIDTHYCCVPECKKWGGFGFARSKAEPVQWWCREHYPHKEPSGGERYTTSANNAV